MISDRNEVEMGFKKVTVVQTKEHGAKSAISN